MSDDSTTPEQWIPWYNLRPEDVVEGQTVRARAGDREFDVTFGAVVAPSPADFLAGWTIDLEETGAELPTITFDPRPNYSAWDDVPVGGHFPVYDEDGELVGVLVRKDEETFTLGFDGGRP